jgi:hypothetical protein
LPSPSVTSSIVAEPPSPQSGRLSPSDFDDRNGEGCSFWK